tara:strand:+ start:1390 stop:3249 length:1860 start_codon:yes stop_codon:yes gene_type:complete
MTMPMTELVDFHNRDKEYWKSFHKNFPSYEDVCAYPEVQVDITTLEELYQFLKLPCCMDSDGHGSPCDVRYRVDVDNKQRVRAFFTMRERKYICRVRHYDCWSRNTARYEGKRVELIGIYSQRHHDYFREVGTLASNLTLREWEAERSKMVKYDYARVKENTANQMGIQTSDQEEYAKLLNILDEQNALERCFARNYTHSRTITSHILCCEHYEEWLRRMKDDLCLYVHDPALREQVDMIVMPEFFEELYEDCYIVIPQWWRCDYSSDRVIGHRWEAPIINGSRYKPEHVEENFVRCPITDEWTHKDTLIEYNGRWASKEGLLSIGVRFCSRCGQAVEETSMYINKCMDCGDKALAYAMQRDINSYHNFDAWMIRCMASENPLKTLLMGVELEVDGYGRPDYDDCHSIRKRYKILGDIQHDGSLSEGCEFITHPSSHRYHQKYLPTFSSDMIEHYHDPEGESNDCGVHIHINRSFIGYGEDNETCRKMDWFFHRYKPYVCRIAGRRSASWARFSKDYSRDSWEYFGKDNHENRYQAINFNNFNTVEFRVFATPDYDGIHMMRYIDFVDSLVHWSMQATKQEVMNDSAWDYYKAFVHNREKKYQQLHKVLTNDSYFRKKV